MTPRRRLQLSAVILVVENGDVQTAAKGLDLGASDYIETPFDVSELIARIRSQLRRKRYSDRLRSNLRNGLKLAVIDPLTGIYNRRYAAQHMNRVMERARETDGVFAVMMIDLDKFKSINDRFGHDAGDAVLREFSRRLQENIRMAQQVHRRPGFRSALLETVDEHLKVFPLVRWDSRLAFGLAPDKRFYSGYEFHRMKGFGHIVFGTELKRPDFIYLQVFSR